MMDEDHMERNIPEPTGNELDHLFHSLIDHSEYDIHQTRCKCGSLHWETDPSDQFKNQHCKICHTIRFSTHVRATSYTMEIKKPK